MAGWLKRVDGSGLESFKIHQNVEETKPLLDHEPLWSFETKEAEEKECHSGKLKFLFDEFLPVFLQTIFGALCFRPLPPMLGDGQSVDLFKLYLNVREKGGFEKVSENGQWNSLAEECGFDLVVGSSLKLVYVKYLGALSRSLERVFKGKYPKSGIEQSGSGCLGELLMGLESDLKGFLSGISDKKEENAEPVNEELKTELGFECDGTLFDEHGGFVKLNGDVENLEKESLVKDVVEGGDESVNGKGITGDEDGPFVFDIGQVRRTEDVDSIVHSSGGKGDVNGRKRRRECHFGMLNWINRVAMDPCDPGIGSLPDSSKWKYYASDLVWKQVLLVRQEMLLKKNNEPSDQQAVLQKKQKMHPTMYDDPFERQRFSQRILSAKTPSRKSRARIFSETSSPATQSDDDLFQSQSDSSADSEANFVGSRRHRKKKIPIGPLFQADIPEWTGKTCECDSKWLGTRLWPLERVEQNRNLIERERIGKGRQDSCGCQFPGSFACIRFHVSEKRTRLKLELGPTFYRLKFENMGEEVAGSWTKEEEVKFRNTVKSNPLSLGMYFWREIVKCFPSKGRESLVSYYYNVFLLQRRGEQNRFTPNDINSDDDESEAVYNTTNSPGSIFCSPKKPHMNVQ